MNKNNWIKGAMILGLSFFIAIFLVKPIGVSTQFSVLSGIIHSTIDSDVIVEDSNRESGYASSNAYYDKSEGQLAKNKRKNGEEDASRDIEYCILDDNKKGFLGKYAPSFIGGFILLYGARMADGCTSGHMMSGMMQGSVSGYVFAAAVFATAIPTAIIVKKIKKAK